MIVRFLISSICKFLIYASIAAGICGCKPDRTKSERAFEALRKYEQRRSISFDGIMDSDFWIDDPGFYVLGMKTIEVLRKLRDASPGYVEVRFSVICIGKSEKVYLDKKDWEIEVNGSIHSAVRCEPSDDVEERKIANGAYWWNEVVFVIPTELVSDGFVQLFLRHQGVSRMQWKMNTSGRVSNYPEIRKMSVMRNYPVCEMYVPMSGKGSKEFDLISKSTS